MHAPLPPIGPNRPWLAPLAGFSDLPFRLLCRERGAAAACTEMVSAKGLVYDARNPGAGDGSEALLHTAPEDTPLIVQLFGAEPEFLAEAGRLLRARGFAYFDLNMGCSVPKVVKTGAGAAMMRDPERAVKAAAALIRAVAPCPVGIKLRLGPNSAEENFLSLGRALEDAGAAWLTLHPRWASQGFAGEARHEASARLARAVSVPLLISGDLLSAEGALDRLQESGAAGLMFARGALSDPTIFARFTALYQGETPCGQTPQELRALIFRHLELIRLHSPHRLNRRGLSPDLLKMRTVIPRYVRRLPGARELRKALCTVVNAAGAEALLQEFFGRSRTRTEETNTNADAAELVPTITREP